MDSEKVASLATMSGAGSATVAGIAVPTIGMYLAIGAVAGVAGYVVYKVGKKAFKSFSDKAKEAKSEKRSAMVADEVA